MKQSVLLMAVVALLVLLTSQQMSYAEQPAGVSEHNFLPIVSREMPIPTATPTATMLPTATPTMAPVGNGIYRRDSITYYPGYTGTKAFGFVRFFDGSPAWGGPDNFHVWVCFDGGQGCYRSTHLDASGYYDVNINGAPAPPIQGPGFAYLARGQFDQEVRVSQNFAIDTSAGSCWRMDWIECGTGSPDPVCQGTTLPFAGKPTLLPSAGPETVLGCPP